MIIDFYLFSYRGHLRFWSGHLLQRNVVIGRLLSVLERSRDEWKRVLYFKRN